MGFLYPLNPFVGLAGPGAPVFFINKLRVIVCVSPPSISIKIFFYLKAINFRTRLSGVWEHVPAVVAVDDHKHITSRTSFVVYGPRLVLQGQGEGQLLQNPDVDGLLDGVWDRVPRYE